MKSASMLCSKFIAPGVVLVLALMSAAAVTKAAENNSLPVKKADQQTTRNTHVAPLARVGETAPDFTLLDQFGKKRSLSDYRGQVIVLEWTNPGCPFIVRHYNEKTMIDLQAKFGGKKLTWLRINSTNKKHQDYMTGKETQAWAKKVGVEGPILNDSEGLVGHLYGAKTTPHMFVVDASGKLAYSGAIDDDPRGSKSAEDRVNYVGVLLTGWQSGGKISPTANDSYGCGVKYAK